MKRVCVLIVGRTIWWLSTDCGFPHRNRILMKFKNENVQNFFLFPAE